MAKRNDTKKKRPRPSQPTFSVSPVPAVNNPPPSGPVSNPDVKGKGSAKNGGQSSTSIAETTTELLNPLSVRFQAPVRWVYNYDHTDPLNFGFMFPVEPGSSTEFSPLNTHPIASTLSGSTSVSAPAPTYGSIGTPFFPVDDSPQSSIEGQRQWDLASTTAEHVQQHFVPSDQSTASASYQHEYPIHQSLPYRYSPHPDLPGASTHQFVQPFVAPSEEQIW
jgi:hypothetical protein